MILNWEDQKIKFLNVCTQMQTVFQIKEMNLRQ